MTNEPQHNIISPNGKYTLLFGRVDEYSMGGANACPIYLHEQNEDIITLHIMCADKPLRNEDSTTVYFPVWFTNEIVRLKQCVAKYDTVTKKVSLYKKLFTTIEISKLENELLTILDYRGNASTFNVLEEAILTDDYKIEK
jgi:hypothetical protein